VDLNTAGGNGGAVSLIDRSQLISRGSVTYFSQNTCAEYGGAFYMAASNYSVHNSSEAGDVFQDNTAHIAGGALFWNWDSMHTTSSDYFMQGAMHGNYAKDGPNASTPIRYIETKHANSTEISSTSGFREPVEVYAYDIYGQVRSRVLMTEDTRPCTDLLSRLSCVYAAHLAPDPIHSYRVTKLQQHDRQQRASTPRHRFCVDERNSGPTVE